MIARDTIEKISERYKKGGEKIIIRECISVKVYILYANIFCRIKLYLILITLCLIELDPLSQCNGVIKKICVRKSVTA